MKSLNYFLIVLTLLSLSLSAAAQNFYYGLEGGVNFANVNLESANGTDQLTSPQTGFVFGGVFGYPISHSFSLELEALYIQKGGMQMANSQNPNIEIRMSVLEVPLFAKVSFGNTIRPYIKAGPAIGIILNSDAETEYGGAVAGQSLQTYKADMQNVLKRIDFGLSFGTGISFAVGNTYLFIESRYTLGLTDLYKGGELQWISGDESFTVEGNPSAAMYNKGIQVIIGITLPQ